MTDRPAPPADQDTAPLAPIAAVLGLLLLVAAGTQFTHLPRWSDDYGVLVYPAFVLFLASAAGLLWWGAKTSVRLIRTGH
ncbi:hypothetical protein [Nocardia pneumoniae]|uniref:hypothetical protein n=1 Tax=Nocardia pneumoniae TaxID=228601 RepID=UPI0002F5AAFD|nr:hypothetical protein [Nocardia pneumoniae]